MFYRQGWKSSNENYYLANIYLFKRNNRNTRKKCEICSKLTIKTSKRRQWRRSGVFIVNFDHISHLIDWIESLSIYRCYLLRLNKLDKTF